MGDKTPLEEERQTMVKELKEPQKTKESAIHTHQKTGVTKKYYNNCFTL